MAGNFEHYIHHKTKTLSLTLDNSRIRQLTDWTYRRMVYSRFVQSVSRPVHELAYLRVVQ